MQTPSIFASKFFRFLAFIIGWAIIANIFVWLNPPEHKLINQKYQLDYFKVCVIENNQPKTLSVMNLTKDSVFCHREYDHIEQGQPWFYFSLKQIDNEWEITQYSDSMSDPWVYRYRIENNNIIPLWYHYGSGFVLHFTSWLYALFATMIIYAITNRIIHHRDKDPKKLST